MALETATYVDSLVVSNPDGTDQRSTADDHLRLIKACLKRSFPQIGGPVSASAVAISYVNDLSASAQAQLNTLREGSATANNAINSRFANSASVAANVGTVSAANVPSKAASNTFTGNPQIISNTAPELRFIETDAPVDESIWAIHVTSGNLRIFLRDDAGVAGVAPMSIERTTSNVDLIRFTGDAITLNGQSLLNPTQLNSVAAASYARLDIAQTFAKGAGSTIVALTDAATITPNCEDGNVFRVVLGGNRTMAAPSNPRSGQTIVIHVLQPASGGPRTLTWNSIYRFAGSTDPTLSTGANDRDVFAFNYDSVSNVWCQAGLNVG